MDALDSFLLFTALPLVVALSLIEALVLARRGGYDWRGAGVSLLDLVVRVGVQLFVRLSIATPLIVLAERYRLGHIPLSDGWALLALFLGQELCYYGYHRAAHRVRWFWCNHAVHHTPNQLTLVAAFRIGFLGQLSGVALFFAPLVWLGFPTRVVFQMLSLNLLYQFWIHATWIPRLGWLEYVFNTPSAHRVHHAANLEYLDANYGGVLIVFDRLFGTYRAERAGLPCRYGLVEPVRGHDFLAIEFGRWAELGRDLLRARTLRAVLGALFMPPGWHPGGDHHRTEDLRRRAGLPPA